MSHKFNLLSPFSSGVLLESIFRILIFLCKTIDGHSVFRQNLLYCSNGVNILKWRYKLCGDCPETLDQVTLDIRSASNKAVLKSNPKTYLFRMALILCSNVTLSFCLYAAFCYFCYMVVLLSFLLNVKARLVPAGCCKVM